VLHDPVRRELAAEQLDGHVMSEDEHERESPRMSCGPKARRRRGIREEKAQSSVSSADSLDRLTLEGVAGHVGSGQVFWLVGDWVRSAFPPGSLSSRQWP